MNLNLYNLGDRRGRPPALALRRLHRQPACPTRSPTRARRAPPPHPGPARARSRSLCSAAYDIELEDGQWSEHLELAAGSAKAVVKQLAAGENYTHSYKLVAGVRVAAIRPLP